MNESLRVDQLMPSLLDYQNRTGREPGCVVRAMSAVLPGVSRVWSQVAPYADAWHSGNLETIDRPGRRWVVLGDSMSQGIGASAHDAGWVGQLALRLTTTDHQLLVVNLSATGARVRDVLDQQIPVLDQLGGREDDLVTVMVGSNDLFGGAALRKALPEAYAELVHRVPSGSIVATLPQPSGAADQANAHIERAADDGRIVMVDLRIAGPPSWRGRLASDFFHPNDVGYAAIANAFEPALRTTLA
jgi:lysophospholipase L1-like esterase